MKEIVCPKAELAGGEMVLAQLGPIRVVVIRSLDGDLHALAAKCLHQGGPLELGKIYDHHATSDDVGEYVTKPDCEVLKCPWHGYEYDVRTGTAVFDSTRGLQKFSVYEEGNDIVVELGASRTPLTG